MARLRRLHGGIDRLGIAHLADQDDIGVLAQRRAQAGAEVVGVHADLALRHGDRKSTRLNSSHLVISYAVFCLKKKKLRRRSLRTHLLALLTGRVRALSATREARAGLVGPCCPSRVLADMSCLSDWFRPATVRIV